MFYVQWTEPAWQAGGAPVEKQFWTQEIAEERFLKLWANGYFPRLLDHYGLIASEDPRDD